MKHLFYSLITIMIIMSSCSNEEPVLKIGLVADPQYADKPTAGLRHYRESLRKLKEAIDTFEHVSVDFVQNLGDIIDDEWRSYDSILAIYKHLNQDIENYHLLGNHDFAVDSLQFTNLLETLSMPDYYYSYIKKDWRFIVLDATDYAYFSNSLHNHDIDQINSYYDNTAGKPNNQIWNGAIGEEQQNWLRQELESAKLLEQNVIIFSHMPVQPLSALHNVWNDYEITDIIENSPNVVAFINGHNHAGGYISLTGIHYITISGMVDTMVSSYAILEIFKDRLVLKGYGNQQSITIQKNTRQITLDDMSYIQTEPFKNLYHLVNQGMIIEAWRK